jgi:hypothetical protein
MLLVVVILLVSFLVIPLLDLITAERIRTLAKILVLGLACLWEIYELLLARGVV